VVGQAGSLNGAPDANHPMPGVAAVSGNLFSEQIVGLTGQPAQGNFTTTEHIQPMLGNIHSPSVTSGALHGANLVDFIGFTSKSSSFGNANLYNLGSSGFVVGRTLTVQRYRSWAERAKKRERLWKRRKTEGVSRFSTARAAATTAGCDPLFTFPLSIHPLQTQKRHNLQRQTFTVTLPSGVSYPLSTVINQWSQMRNGSLTAAYPTVINP